MLAPHAFKRIVLTGLWAVLAACAGSERERADAERDESSEMSEEEDGGLSDAALDAGRAVDGGSEREDAGKHDAGGPVDGGRGTSALPACPGHTHPPPTIACRTLADCGGGSFACGASVIPACGVCSPSFSQCMKDADCGAGRICVQGLSTGCPSCGGPIGMMCTSACTATSCTPGMRCGANGRCEIAPCTEGGSCAPDRICDASRAGADIRGCAPASCESDGYECPAGSRCGGAQKDANGCSAISCAEGYACPVNHDCKPDLARGHGCVRRTCSVDTDCDCGACLAAVCMNQLNVCSLGAP